MTKRTQTPRVFHQQFRASGFDHRPALQMPLAGRVVFKWIKQHLRIKTFFGTNENAVKTQIWIAISVYVLVAIVKKRLGVAASLYTILQILSLTLSRKHPLDQLLNDIALQKLDSVDSNQLNLFS